MKILHNPRCSKSRETLKILNDHDLDPEIILYLESPPTVAELKQIIELLGIKPRELLRKSESAYKEQQLSDASLSDQHLIEMMAKFPKLIERPIVITNDRAVIGRPPSAVLELI